MIFFPCLCFLGCGLLVCLGFVGFDFFFCGVGGTV